MMKATHISAASSLKSFSLLGCIVIVLSNSSALAERSSLPYAKGGFSASFAQLARDINQSGELFRIEGTCQSACTMFLSLRKVCVDRNATLLFHSGRRLGAVGGRERMLNTYHAKLRKFLIANHYMDTPEFHAISGSDIVQKFGYRACPQNE
jgi:hypothetical protein